MHTIGWWLTSVGTILIFLGTGLTTIGYFVSPQNNVISNMLHDIFIKQEAKEMSGVVGMDLRLDSSGSTLLEDVRIDQTADKMSGVIGLKAEGNGEQSMVVKNLEINRPGQQVKIGSDPNVKVEFFHKG